MNPSTGRQEPLPFAKMSGAGNDFVVIDNRNGRVADPGDLTRRICARGVSVGADGLILIENSPRATFRMRYYNSDGGLSEFCANGTRCAARFAFINVIAARKMTIDTDAGIVAAEISDHGAVTLSLPSPRDFVTDRRLVVGDRTIHGSSILVGVPHYVIFLRGELWSQDVVPLGRTIREHHDLQPAGANVNFVVIRDPSSIEIRTYERGVEAETLACGSGIVASVSTGAMFGRLKSPVSVLTRSGITVEVAFELAAQEVRNVRLKGDARLVYRASLTPETVEGFDPEFVRHPTERVEVP